MIVERTEPSILLQKAYSITSPQIRSLKRRQKYPFARLGRQYRLTNQHLQYLAWMGHQIEKYTNLTFLQGCASVTNLMEFAPLDLFNRRRQLFVTC